MEVLSKYVSLLESLGFQIANGDYDPIPQEGDILYVERELCRNRIAILFPETGGFRVFVQINVGCGWVTLPFLWRELEATWLTDLKKAFTGVEFSK